MTTNGDSNFSYFIIGFGLGVMAAMLAHRETRELVRKRSGKSLDYVNQQAGKLREAADTIVQQGKKLIACKGSDTLTRSTEGEKQAYEENRRENLGG